MITKKYSLDMNPGGQPVVVHLSQYDEDVRLVFSLYSSYGTLNVESGTTAVLRGTKADGNAISIDEQLSKNGDEVTVTVDVDKQMTAAAGKNLYELTLYSGSKRLSSANFVIQVKRTALDKDTVASDSKIREYTEYQEHVDDIIEAGRKAYESQEEIAKLKENIQEASEKTSTTTEEAKEIEKRINEKATAIALITTKADEVAAQALSAAGNAENAVAEFENTVQRLKEIVEMNQLTLEGKVDDGIVDKGYLILTSNGSPVSDRLGPFSSSGTGGGGGSSSGNNAVLSVNNATGWLSKTIADGDECVVSLSWSSTEDDMTTGDGTARIMVNGVVKAMVNIKQGLITIDVAPYIATGSNVVKITVSDIYDNSRTISFSVTSVTINLSSSFDASTPYQTAILFPYTPTGSVSKNLHFMLDGKEIGSNTTSVSGRQMSYTIPAQSHGAHTLEVYFDCTINGQTVESKHLYYEIICLDPLSLEPVIVSSFNEKKTTQYTTLHVDYTVYNPTSLTAKVSILVNEKQATELTVDRSQQTFTYRADKTGELEIAIVSGDARKTIVLDVEESDIDVEAETEGLSLYLTSTGRNNKEATPETWEYKSYAAKLTGFNFKSDGWLNDKDGITALRVSGDARVEIPYKVFARDPRITGQTIELEFATSAVMNYDTPIISCMSGGRGFEITPQLARLNSEQSQVSMQFKEDEHVRITFVIEKRSENRLLYIYVNGVMSGAVQYPTNDDFTQAQPVNIVIGSNECTTDIYNIRVYNNNLNRNQILTNWIADTQDVTQMLARYQRNSVYDEYCNVVISKLPKDLPYMIIECEELPQYKGDKKTAKITYVDPVKTSKSYTAEGVQIDVQGTSSQYYPRKNYKAKYKKGMTLENGTQVDTYALRDGAIPASVFTYKADVASSEGANNVELVRLYNDTCPYKTPAQVEDSRVRQGIDGFPIVAFWSNGEETSFLGKYNFNNDKSSAEVFGFIEGDESWEVLNNTSDRVLFKTADFSGDAWLNDFEARFPDTDPAYEDAAQLAEFVSWVASTDTEAATGNSLPETVTYDGVSYSKDTAEYRLAKFKAEASDYMEMDSAIFYYLFTEMFVMVDSRGKNMFPSFIGGSVV